MTSTPDPTSAPLTSLPPPATLPPALAASLGLAATLSNPALALTVFVPSDAAFTSLATKLGLPLADPANIVLSSAQKSILRNVMYYHMVSGADGTPGTFNIGKLRPGMSLDTMYLSPLTKKAYQLSVTSVTGDAAAPVVQLKSIGTSALVNKPDIKCGAGVAHGIDNVFVPMSMSVVQALV